MARTTAVETGTTSISDFPDGGDLAEVASSLRLSITRLSRILRQQDGGGLTPSATSALALLNRYGPMTLGELAAREHVAAPTVTRIVEKLQAAGLATRRVSEHDGRVFFVDTTDEGRALILDARSRRTRWLIEHFAALTPDELDALKRAAPILERLVEQATSEEER
ncbi:MAG: putative MarR-family transcriptional regulator [Acidimicrobiia bacterium]|nr:putative MarR-family transcriptional regulator [Acidimicrobiia bacterium]